MDTFGYNFFKDFLEWCEENEIEWIVGEGTTTVRGPDGWMVSAPKGLSMADFYPRLVTFLSLYEDGFARHADVPINERQLREFSSRQNLFHQLGRSAVRFPLTRPSNWMN